MRQYLDILERVLTKGKPKTPFRQTENRKLTDTIGLANVVFNHNMCDGFPLLTTKKMGLKNIAIELEGFIKGITSKSWYQQKGCNIWQEWANPQAVKDFYFENYEKPYLEQETYDKEHNILSFTGNFLTPFSAVEPAIKQSIDDLGPIYGYQWRNFNKTYPGQSEDDGDYTNYTDQLKNITDTLTKNPTDRRMVCSAWNPNQISMMALPPCHFVWNVVVYDGKLNLWWGQRSCDLLLGVPYNIASYALLLCLLAKHANLEPGNLLGVLADCHLYENQLDVARQQLEREPRNLPTLEIPNNYDTKWGGRFDFWQWDHTQLKLKDYNPHGPLEKVAVVV